MKNRTKNILQLMLLVALITFAFWFALKDDMPAVLANIKNVQLPILCVIIILGILYYLLQGWILAYIAKSYDSQITYRDGIENAYIAAFFNGITPLGGGQVAQTFAFRKLGLSYHHIASILWKDFFLYQVVIITFSAVLIITHLHFAIDKFPVWIWLVIVGWFINASVILLLLSITFFPKLYMKISSMLITLLHKLHIIKDPHYIREKWNTQLQHFAQEANHLKEEKRLILRGLLINFVRMLIYYSIPFVVAIGIGVPLGMQDFILVLALSCFIHMLNALTPLPGDTGWTESAFIVIFCVLTRRPIASSIMILWRMSTYYIHVMIGGLIFMQVKMRKKHVHDDYTTPDK